MEERAAGYAEVHPDRPASFARRMAARLRRALGRPPTGRTPSQSDDVWAREEARYRAKNEGKSDT
jgi:hypothetical protein